MILAKIASHRSAISFFFLTLFYSETVLAARLSKSHEGIVISKSWEVIRKEVKPQSALPASVSDVKINGFKSTLLKDVDAKISNKIPTTNNIGGPGQPEMLSFKSVGADNMVDMFSGDFSYNIPLGDVGGYPINIFYNSGVSMDQEASWVGLGWNLNPGTINRSVRGIPDDFNGEEFVQKTQSIKSNITVGVGFNGTLEIAGMGRDSAVKASAKITYNNFKGVGLDFSLSPTLTIQKASANGKTAGFSGSLGLNLSSQGGLNVNPSFEMRIHETNKKYKDGTLSLGASYNSRYGLQSISLSSYYRNYSLPGLLSFAKPSYIPTISMPITNRNFNFGFSSGKEWPLAADLKLNSYSGFFSSSKIDESDEVQRKYAYGYLYYQNANFKSDALLDINRANDGVYTKSSPTISLPIYTYDTYSIQGEGIGGSFRPYRRDIGIVKSPDVRTKEGSASLDIELSTEKTVKLGANFDYYYTPAYAGGWQSGNLAKANLLFKENTDLKEAVYFKNPSERPLTNSLYYNANGADQMVRIGLDKTLSTTEPPAIPIWEVYNNDRTRNAQSIKIPEGNILSNKRDIRNQVISYLNASDASVAGLEKEIKYFKQNEFPKGECISDKIIKLKRFDNLPSEPNIIINSVIRRRHHLSEISILQTDGRRYIYGIPAYNTLQKEVSFSALINNVVEDKQLVGYSGDLNRLGKEGTAEFNKDEFKSVDEMAPYAHSYLLSALLSPDYVDLTNDGITDDDLGTAVKFNYTKVSWGNKNSINWRTPYTADENIPQAAYSGGLKTVKNDEKGSYIYGEKELWYLNSIESKNMIATFTISNDRHDGREAKSEKGGVGVYGHKKLEKIDIYTKPEWYGKANPVPVKTIHFEYDYSLCPGTPDNPFANQGEGKLTLKNIWFSFNGIEKQVRNKYSFKYSDFNPTYDRTAQNRWSNYQSKEDIEQSEFNKLKQEDYPFVLQNKAVADKNASAWNLTEIRIPSGAKIKVTYECDDYGYVQNKRSAQMFRIQGFSKTLGSPISNQIYTGFNTSDNLYVYIKHPVNSREEVYSKFLEGITQLYFKLWVKMPRDQYNYNDDAFEPVPIYAKIAGLTQDGALTNESYGIQPDHSGFWIKIQEDRDGRSPLYYNSSVFLQQYLPSKAYPGSDVRGAKPLGIIKALFALSNNIITALTGFDNAARLKGWMKKVDLDRSLVRLDCPTFSKLGGGHRVKRIEIEDSWDKLTTRHIADAPSVPNASKSIYGQNYDYTTKQLVNGTMVQISSGVATYEPHVGSEENPFREILYYDQGQTLGPTQRGSVELPICESFYPNPQVGYSKITVSSIHSTGVKSATGKSVSEFYTSRDFPTLSDYTDLIENENRIEYKSHPILKFLKVYNVNKVTLSQGFRVQLNDMNGKPKLMSSYNSDNKLVTSTEYNYKMTTVNEHNHKLSSVVDVVKDNSNEIVKNAIVGKDIEIMVDEREHKSITIGASLQTNTDINEVPNAPSILVIQTLLSAARYSEDKYKAISTVKIVSTFGILDNIKTIDKGSVVYAKDLLYDAETGEALLSSTTNEFNHPIYKFNYPAHWAYKGMQGAYKNIGYKKSGLTFQNGKLTTRGFKFLLNTGNESVSVFEGGDELLVTDNSRKGAYEEAACAPPGVLPRIPKSVDEHGEFVRKIWVVDLNKDPANNFPIDKRFVFVDQSGNPYSGANVDIQIIRSGRRNLLNASVGAIVSRQSLTKEINQKTGLNIPSQDAVVNASATTFTELWRPEKLFKTKIIETQTTKYAPVHSIVVKPNDVHTAVLFTNQNANGEAPYQYFQHYDAGFTNYTTGFVPNVKLDGYPRDNYFKTITSFLKFNFGVIPSGSQIISSEIQLLAHKSPHNGISDYDLDVNHDNLPAHKRSSYVSPTSINLFVSNLNGPWPSGLGGGIDWNNQALTTGSLVAEVPMPTNFWDPAPGGASSFYYSNRNLKTNVKELTQQLLNDFYTLGYPPSLKLFMTGREASSRRMGNVRLCFTTGCNTIQPIGGNTANPPLQDMGCTQLDIKYINCAEAAELLSFPSGTELEPCVQTENAIVCESFEETNKIINPYTVGMLGNWRAKMGYSYYDKRKENKVAQNVEIAKGGTIDNFKEFWVFTNTSYSPSLKINDIVNNPPANEIQPWSWTSAVTQINSKGFEIENVDPLQRFNCGIYGFNEGLPIATANNARLLEVAYDGFEDNNYQNGLCKINCLPKGQIEYLNTQNRISNTISHTGLSSLNVSSGDAYALHIPVIADVDAQKSTELDFKLNTTTQSGTWVQPKGNGLRASYFNFDAPFNLLGVGDFGDPAITAIDGDNPFVRRIEEDMQFTQNSQNYYEYGTPPLELQRDAFAIKWDGYIQFPTSGHYKLYGTADDGLTIWVDLNRNNIFEANEKAEDWSESYKTVEFDVPNANAGSIYKILIKYYEKTKESNFALNWVTPYADDQEWEKVPYEFLYDNSTLADETVITGDRSCVKIDKLNQKQPVFNNKFTPIQETKLIVSGWINIGANSAACQNFADLDCNLKILFGTSVPPVVIKPSGPIIAGWQRFEQVINIPTGATELEVNFQNNSGFESYWDDIRFHPFKANMKSFAYDKQSLRLMAELDENNYATFYEYDNEGTLVRVKKETTDGIKTIKETRSSLQKSNINDN